MRRRHALEPDRRTGQRPLPFGRGNHAETMPWRVCRRRIGKRIGLGQMLDDRVSRGERHLDVHEHGLRRTDAERRFTRRAGEIERQQSDRRNRKRHRAVRNRRIVGDEGAESADGRIARGVRLELTGRRRRLGQFAQQLLEMTTAVFRQQLFVFLTEGADGRAEGHLRDIDIGRAVFTQPDHVVAAGLRNERRGFGYKRDRTRLRIEIMATRIGRGDNRRVLVLGAEEIGLRLAAHPQETTRTDRHAAECGGEDADVRPVDEIKLRQTRIAIDVIGREYDVRLEARAL